MTDAPWATPAPPGWKVRVKAVPGASRDRIQGALGDHLKIQVAAPPEGGKANQSIARLLAEAFGCASAEVRLLSGASNPRKLFHVDGGNLPKV